MTRAARWALGLWLVFAAVVWNVTFDRQAKPIAERFTAEQLERHRHGLAAMRVSDGLTPLLWEAAVRSSVWAGLIAAPGLAATAWALKRAS